MSLRDRADDALDRAVMALSAEPPENLLESLLAHRAQLRDPMRVALVGRIKAGKSTVMNALLGAELAPTGIEELTYNVTRFVHSESEQVVVHFKDGRLAEEYPLSGLREMVDRSQGDIEKLRSIREVEVRLSHAVLEQLELVDTPGFSSFFDTDSRNTLAFLNIAAEDVDEMTRSQARGADAVIYLFARGIAASDREFVADFEGASVGDFTPVNAIAVLTKVDAYWSADTPDDDPLSIATAITTRLKNEPGVDRIFFDVLPVCGLLAAGAQTLTAADFDALAGLAKLPAGTLARLLRNARRFASGDLSDGTITAAARRGLLQRLGQFGIWAAARAIRADGVSSDELADRLLAESGLRSVQRVLMSHFADRAALIKSGTAVNRAREQCARAARAGDLAATDAAAVLEEFEINEHAITELGLLRRLYRDDERLGLSPSEVVELITVCGERGSCCSARLGLTRLASIDEMRATAHARVTYWRERADDFGLSSQSTAAIRDLRRSYEIIGYHLACADEHLEMRP